MATDTSILARPILQNLQSLASNLEENAHLLASPGDENISTLALAATKSLFDLGLDLEKHSHPHLHPFLLSILSPPTVTLRSSKSKIIPYPPKPPPEQVLPYTPLSELTVDGLEGEQVWAQMELRGKGVCGVIKEVGGTEEEEGDGGKDDEDGGEEGEEEEGSSEEMDEEEFRAMMAGEGFNSDDVFGSESGSGSGSDDGGEDEGEDESEEGSLDSDEENEITFKDLNADEVSGSEDEDEDEDDEESEGEVAVDEEADNDASDLDEENDPPTSSDEDDVGDRVEEGEDDDSSALAGPSRLPRSKRQHPTLDDEFFSIDEFNRLTEEAEAVRVSSGRLGGEDDDEEEIDELGGIMLEEGDEEEPIGYADFFEPPKEELRLAGKGKGKEEKGKGKGQGGGKKKGKGKRVAFEEDDDVELDNGDDDEDEQDGARDVMGRLKGDLFDDDEEEEEDEGNLSTYQKQQLALAKQIAELEREAIGPKDWTLLGEATSRARPENSLLEEDLDFEQVGKVVPVITEESVLTMEELIKQRIRDNNFNSPVRLRAFEPTPFLPSRYFDLQDQQSTKSLAQIYEDQYQSASTGGAVRDPRDEKLKKEHEEIDKLWGEVCYKLDALSSLNFVPKQPKAQISTIENLPTTTLESALPPTSAATSMLAPQELFAPPSSSTLVARTELTPEEKQRARQKGRKSKQTQVKRSGGMADLYGKKKGQKEQKEEALKGLVKSGKGVTVVGKGEKEVGKVRKREEGERQDGKRLKL